MSRSTPRQGDTLSGRWRLDKKLATGGVGCVFEATDLDKDEKVAVKVMHPHIAARSPFIRRKFLSEGKLAASLGQLGNVETGVTDRDVPFFAMSLLKGEDLQSLRSNSPNECLPTSEVVPAITQALKVLAEAHSRGIIHRDIKPENLFVTNDGKVRVLDFGLADAHGGSRFPEGKFFGTTGYAPPEQLNGKKVDARSDVYAIGATAFELLTGCALEDNDKPPSLKDAAPHVPADVARIIDKALATNPNDRFQNAGEMLKELLPRVTFASPRGTAVLPSRVPAPALPPRMTTAPVLRVSMAPAVPPTSMPTRTPTHLTTSRPTLVPLASHILAMMRR
jgi:serine/threonine-protein kinase